MPTLVRQILNFFTGSNITIIIISIIASFELFLYFYFRYFINFLDKKEKID